MNRRLLSKLLVLATAAGAMLWLFWPVWFGGRSFAYRDAAHFYYPLFEWTCAEWSAGRVPLWNPQENCGQPVLADTTSSVLYPGKLLMVLPLDFVTRYVLYITAHVALAALAAYLLARRWRASPAAAGICAVSYALSGNVLFQYCNVVFLVSAAWLPFALLAVDRMLVRRNWRAAALLGAVLALMTLGGDPQATYHTGLAAVLYAVLLWRRDRRRRRSASARSIAAGDARSSVSLWTRLVTHRFTLLSLAAASGAVLAAVQILPAVEWSRQSDRAAYSVPRNIYEAAAYVARRGPQRKGTLANAARGLLGEPVRGAHHGDIYDFSVAPWRAAELIWPNVSGTMFPVNRRWTTFIPATDRVWTPSLYMGLLPLLLAFSAWRLRRGPLRVRWLSWLVLLFSLASLGWFGLGWLVQEAAQAVGLDAEQALVGGPVGGLYWLMATLLPGYAYFRYPAKLLVFAALPMSVLAARGCDRLLVPSAMWMRAGGRTAAAENKAARWPALSWLLIGLSLASLLLLAVPLVLRPWLIDWLSHAPDDVMFGPIDAPGAANVLLAAFGQTALLAAAAWLLLWLARRQPSQVWAHAALVLVAVDLVAAHGWMVASSPRELWNEPSQFGERITDADPAVASYRVHRASPEGWTPPEWAGKSSPQRLSQGVAWDRGTLLPKYHLRDGHRLAEVYGTMASQDYRVLLNIAQEYGVPRPDGRLEPHPAVLRALSVKYLILPGGFEYPGSAPLDASSGNQGALPTESRSGSRQTSESATSEPASEQTDAEPADAELRSLEGAYPRAWIVHAVDVLPPLTTNESAVVGRRTFEVLFPDMTRRDLRRGAVVEFVSPKAQFSSDSQVRSQTWQQLQALTSAEGRAGVTRDGSMDDGETCRITIDAPQRIEIEAELRRAGLLVLNDLHYPGWQAEVFSNSGDTNKPSSAEILRTNRVMRGVLLPAGKHRIVFIYRPTSFYLGAALSGFGWLALAALGIAVAIAHRRGLASGV